MPSSIIVQDIRSIVYKKLNPKVPRRWVHQFDFGLKAYSLKSFTSANGNARMVYPNPATAGTKCDRLLANQGLADKFGGIFDALGLIRENSFVNIDHTDMNGLMALVGALQTKKGRAIPCFIETTYSPSLPSFPEAPARKKMLREYYKKEKIDQSPTEHTIESLKNFHDRLEFWPSLVFDRGFGNSSIVNYLSREGATFYIRVKKGRFVGFDNERTKIQDLYGKDVEVSLFNLKLRVIRSPKTSKHPEPWYILTNDFKSTRERIVKIYYHRFEIEETFKDIKHIFEFKRTRLNKPNSLKVLLWLISIGIALLYLISRKKGGHHSHKKKKLSWLRESYEELQLAIGLIFWEGG